MATVLVTGGAGYIGSHMTLGLLDRGERVIVLDNLSTGLRDSVPFDALFVEGDIGDDGLVRAILRSEPVDAVIHTAGATVIPESLSDPLGYFATNTASSLTLMRCAVEAGVPNIVFSSTAAVYGEVTANVVDESHPVEPLSPYGRSKLMVEWMLADAAMAHTMRYGVLRYFNVAGADPHGRAGQSTRGATHLIKVAAEAALGLRDALTIYGTDFDTPDGTGVRDYIQVSDLVDAHLLLLSHLRRGGRSVTLNCGYGRGTSVRQIVAAMQTAAGRPLKVVEADRRPGDAAHVVAANDRLRQLLPWRPRFADPLLICQQALDWERRRQTGTSASMPHSAMPGNEGASAAH